jgi:hypothetical protein
MMNYANFVIETCPNLTTLNFDMITGLVCDEKGYADELNAILTSFMDEFLKPLDKGHSELKICLTWMVNCESDAYEVSKRLKGDDITIYNNNYFEDIPRGHLFTLCTQFTTKNQIVQPDIARIVKVADAKGREHDVILQIFIENIPTSDSSQGKHRVLIVFF